MATNNLHKKMKQIEHSTRDYISSSSKYLMVRLDGKAFHTYTKKFNKPFDTRIEDAFQYTLTTLAEKIQSVKIGYSQSDEITLVLYKGEKEGSEHWFNGNIQKITSTSASIATAAFNKKMTELYPELNEFAFFDSRVYPVSETDVLEMLVWRQQDGIRNSVQALAQSKFSKKDLFKKSVKEQKEMLNGAWEELPLFEQRGFTTIRENYLKTVEVPNRDKVEVMRSKWIIDKEIPLFLKDPEYILNKLK